MNLILPLTVLRFWTNTVLICIGVLAVPERKRPDNTTH